MPGEENYKTLVGVSDDRQPAPDSSSPTMQPRTPTVVVLGASYAGHRAVNVLVNTLPAPWRIVVIERNTHANHLYAFPRVAVVPAHEHKVFIPYSNIFKQTPVLAAHDADVPKLADPSKHVLVHGHVTAVRSHSVSYVPLSKDSASTSTTEEEEEEIAFDYLIYALGSHLPAPINIWSEVPARPVPKPRHSISSRASTEASTPIKNFFPSAFPHPLSDSPLRNRDISAALRGLGGLSMPSTPGPFSHSHSGHQHIPAQDVFGVDPSTTHGLAAKLERLGLRMNTDRDDVDFDFTPINKDDDERTIQIVRALQRLELEDEEEDIQRGTKLEGVAWLQAAQRRVREAESVLVIGGGALGVQFATDIAQVYPEKKVTLVHSGTQLLPRFDPWLHDATMSALEKLGVTVMLGSRVDLSTKTRRSLRTCDGRHISAHLILLCTGQKPNTSLLADLAPNAINPRTGMVTVLRSMQIANIPSRTPASHHNWSCAQGLDEESCHCRPALSFRPSSTTSSSSEQQRKEQRTGSPLPHIFVIGDAADAFGALNAGHTAWTQAEVAARNVARLVRSGGRSRLPRAPAPSVSLKPLTNSTPTPTTSKIWEVEQVASPDSLSECSEEGDCIDAQPLESYTAPPPSIKVSLGLDRAIFQTSGKFGWKGVEECPMDLNAPNMWKRRGLSTEDMTI